MIVSAIYCKNPKCNQVVISRSRHDYRSCKCGNVSIDGGRDYVKYNFFNLHPYEFIQLEIDKSKKELVDDYNSKGDFGIFDYENIKDREVIQ